MLRIKFLVQAAILMLLGASAALAQSSPSSFTYGTRYDAMHRVVGTIAPYPGDGATTYYPAVRNTYDVDGRLTKVETGTLSTWEPETVAPSAWGGAFMVLRTDDTIYDPMDRKLTDKLSGTSITHKLSQYTYDVVGRLQCIAVRMNAAAFGSLPPSACTLGTQGGDGPDRITKNSYDPVGQLLLVQEALGVTGQQRNQVAYTYTPDGKHQYVTDANGNKAQFEYDGFDRRVRWDFPSKTTPGVVNSADNEQYGYDANDNRTSWTKRDGNTISYTFDALNRMTLKDIPAALLGNDVTYTYDVRGLMLSALYVGSGAGISFSYDNAGRKLTETNTMTTSRTISYRWDADGNRMGRTDPDGIYFTTDYDGVDRSTVTHEKSLSAQLFTLSYDALGRRSGISRADGATTTYVYDAADRLSSLTQDLPGTANDLVLAFTYNADDQKTTRTLTTSNSAYSYTDSVNGAKAYAPNGLNQYSTVAGTSFSYDLNGNLTSNGADAYTYDAENRVRVITGSHNTTLQYDPLGRLSKLGTTTYFLFDGDDLIAEYDATTGAQNRRYVTGPGEDDPQVWYQGANLTTDRRFHHADEQGSIIAISNSSGLLAANGYDEYGVPSVTTTGIYKYTGQIYLATAAIYYYKARLYDPLTGRFLQLDPVGYADQINLYAYTGNDPVNSEDSSGECTGSIISDSDGGCTGGGFVEGFGGCLGACTSNRDLANMAVDDAISQAKGSAKPGGGDPCLNSPECGGKTPPALMRDLLPVLKNPKFRAAVVTAWTRSGPYGPTALKNEQAFFSNSKTGSIGEVFRGIGNHVLTTDILNHWHGEDVFTHTHPFFRSEGFLFGFSPGDRGFLDKYKFIGVMIEEDGVYYYDGRHR